MKRITIGWSGKEEYLGMLFTHIGSEIKMGKTEGMAHGLPWRVEDDGTVGQDRESCIDGRNRESYIPKRGGGR